MHPVRHQSALKADMTDAAASALDSLLVWTLGDDALAETASLTALRAGRAMVLDFWTSKCVKCPAALERLNEEAAEADKEVVFVSCALSQGEGNKGLIADMVGDWEHLTHTFLDLEHKEAAKAAFGFAAVPFYVVLSADGRVLAAEGPKAPDFAALLAAADAGEAAAEADVPAPATSDVFTLDEDF